LFLVGKSIIENHSRGREVAKHEFVTLLGDLRRGGDIDDIRNALLLRDLRDGGALARVESTDENLRAIAYELLGARTGNFHLCFRIGIHDLKRRQAELLEKTGRNIDAALTILTDTGLYARAREQYADFQGCCLGAHKIQRSDSGESGHPQTQA